MGLKGGCAEQIGIRNIGSGKAPADFGRIVMRMERRVNTVSDAWHGSMG